MHLSDFGRFYPSSGDIITSIGGNRGINVGWEPIEGDGFDKIKVRDEEYVYVFDTILQKIIKSFNPNVCVIAAGFDALKGDPTTDGRVNIDKAYPYMAQKLSQLCENKIILTLEGGYEIKAVGEAVWNTIRALTNEKMDFNFESPNLIGLQTVEKLKKELVPYWPILEEV